MSFVIVPHNSPEYDSLEDKLSHLSFTYLHGKLEDDAGYDCYSMLDCDFPRNPEYNYSIDYTKLENGIYPCTYKNKKCSLYFWKCSSNRPHGLIIYDSDKKSLKYVKKQYEEKAFFI